MASLEKFLINIKLILVIMFKILLMVTPLVIGIDGCKDSSNHNHNDFNDWKREQDCI